MEPVFLSLDEVLEIHEQQIDLTAEAMDYETRPDWNPPWPRPRRHSAANSCTLPFPRWQQRTFFI